MRWASGFTIASVIAITLWLFGERMAGWVFSRNDRWQDELDRMAGR